MYDKTSMKQEEGGGGVRHFYGPGMGITTALLDWTSQVVLAALGRSRCVKYQAFHTQLSSYATKAFQIDMVTGGRPLVMDSSAYSM